MDKGSIKRARGLNLSVWGPPASSLPLMSLRAMTNIISICHSPMLWVLLCDAMLIDRDKNIYDLQSSCVDSPCEGGPLLILPALLLGRISVCRPEHQSRTWGVGGEGVVCRRGAQTPAMQCAKHV